MTSIKINSSKNLYKIFIFLALYLFFFSTAKVESKGFDINNIEISRPFELNFDKNTVIDEGFRKAFSELILLIVNSSDQKKIKQPKLNEIKSMINSFSIKQEKFINDIYYVNLGVTFNKKEIYKFLEKKNIFPSAAPKKKFLFFPIIIDENKNEPLIFYENEIFNKWNDSPRNSDLIEYILPTEDLEDFNIIKNNFDKIEEYNFKEIISKYSLDESIIALIFKNNENLRILSRIYVNKKTILKNQTFSNMTLNKNENIDSIIENLKTTYEDYWKNFNRINTSIKLPIFIKVDSKKIKKISKFEKILKETDLVYDYNISKIDKNFLYYKIIFNGTSTVFLKTMNIYNYNFDTQNKLWILR